jgi:hypothetical protein
MTQTDNADGQATREHHASGPETVGEMGHNSISLLIDEIKGHLEAADKCFADAQKCKAEGVKLIEDGKRKEMEAEKIHEVGVNRQIEAGKALAKLKAEKPEGKEWGAYVKEHFGLGKSRANELIRIAAGKTTVAETLEGKAKSKAKSRAKRRPLHKDGSGRRQYPKDDPEPHKEAHISGDDLENYRTSFLLRADHCITSAVYSGPVLSDLPPIARQVADAWNSLAETMERVLCEDHPDTLSSLRSKMKKTVHLRLSGLTPER